MPGSEILGTVGIQPVKTLDHSGELRVYPLRTNQCCSHLEIRISVFRLLNLVCAVFTEISEAREDKQEIVMTRSYLLGA
jgi:hypothetical protein